MQFTLEMLVAA